MNKIGLIVPTLNAGKRWSEWLAALRAQTVQPDRVLVIDSSSSDETPALARAAGLELMTIRREDFNHGATRQLGVAHLADCDIIVFLTQDALLGHPEAMGQLVAAFDDPAVGAAYGRQLPHVDASPIGAHARLFNYPATSDVRGFADRIRLGLKTAFMSNSFAAYRRGALGAVGGFPSGLRLNEDTWAAGRMLIKGWKVAYCADGCVHHSHDYSFRQEVQRYFEIGVFHAQTPWLQQTFGRAEGEGKRFVMSELRYLSRHAPWLIPSAMTRTGLKWLGFKLGALIGASPAPLLEERFEQPITDAQGV